MKLYIKIFCAAVLMISFSSCDTYFEEVNTNPNGVSDVNPAHLFASGARATFRSGISGGYDYRIASQLSHYYVGVNAEHQVDQYLQDLSGSSYESLYDSEYKSKLKYYNEVLKITAPGMEKENKYQYATADVMAVLAYSILTDAFGSIPYFEGGFGNSGKLLPKYDTQEVVYDDLLRRLSEDIEMLKTASGSVDLIGQDPVFGDDPDLWLRFANSLRLRLAMRIRFVAPQKAAPMITASLGEPLMTSNDHNAVFFNKDGEDSQLFSPWYSTFDFYNFRISERLVDQLQNTNDPRLPVYATQMSDGTYHGFTNGLTDAKFAEEIGKEHSFPNEYLVGKAAPTYLMTAGEIEFLQAECALFGLGGSDANQHYQDGIALSMEKIGVEQADIDAFLASPAATLTGTQEEQFEQICTQAWIEYAPNFTEAFAAMRRTGYPAIPKRDGINTSLGDTDGVLPSRNLYPLSEKLTNTANVDEAISNLPGGNDVISSRVWWDVRR